MPDEKAGALRMLQHFHSTGRNLLFASDDTAALQTAFDPQWDSAVPYTVLLAADAQASIRNSVLLTSLNSAAKSSSVFPQTTLASTAIGPHLNSPLFLWSPRLASDPRASFSRTHTSLLRAPASLCSLCGEFLLTSPLRPCRALTWVAPPCLPPASILPVSLSAFLLITTYNLKLTTDN